MSADTEVDLAPLLEAKAELEGATPTEQTPKPTEQKQDAPSKAEPESTEKPQQDEPTDDAGETHAVEDETAAGPDLSWLPESERAAYAALPDDAKGTLQRIRKGVLKGLTKAQQDAATHKRDAEFARNLGSPEERSAYLEWRRQRFAGETSKAEAQAEAKKSRLEELLGDPDLVAALREEIAAVGGEKAREVVAEPTIRTRAVDEALVAARGEDVSDEEFAAAAKEITATFGGRPYDFVTPDTAAHFFTMALRTVRAQKAVAPKVTSAPALAQKAAVIQGKSQGRDTKPIPRWVAEKRPPSDEEVWAETLEHFGLDRARAAQLLKNGQVTVAGS